MDLVVDASVIIAVILNEPPKSQLIAVTRSTTLLAPSSLPWEVGNALSAAMRRNRLTHEQAQTAINVYRQIPIRLVDVDLVDAVGLAAELKIYAYDAYVLQTARYAGCPLLTLDARQRELATQIGLDVLVLDEV